MLKRGSILSSLMLLASMSLVFFSAVSCRSRNSSRSSSLPAGSVRASSVCKPQKPDDTDDLGSVRADMRQLECLLVLHENQPGMDADAIKKMRKLNERIVSKLASRNKWDNDIGAWERLYLFTARLNAVRNSIARQYDIPVYSVNGHHRAASIWIEESKRQPVKTLLHFDSHSDTRGMSDPKKLLSLGKGILGDKKVNKAKAALDQYLGDPATPCSAAIMVLGIKHFIWAKPRWYNLENVVARPFFYGQHTVVSPGEKRISKKWELYYDKSTDNTGGPEIPADSTWKILPKPAETMGKFSFVRRLLVSVLTTNPWPKEVDQQRMLKRSLLTAVPKGRFILDIDLDYFGSVDLTRGLAPKAVPAGYRGRNKYLSSEEMKKREEVWRAHRRFMEERFKELEVILQFLRENGRIPSHVTLSDSTYMPYAIHWWAEEFWEYTPKRIVPYVQHRVRKILANVYGADGIGAVP